MAEMARLLIPAIRLAAKAGMARSALRLARAGARLDDARSFIRWELAKLLLPLERAATGPDERRRLAAELLTSLEAASGSSETLIRRASETVFAEALYRSGYYREALAVADLALTQSLRVARLVRVKANALIALGRFPEGKAAYGELLASEPANVELQRKAELLAPLAGYSISERAMTHERCADDKSPLLVGVGGGVGDILHATPLIRNLALRTRYRIDVVVVGDHAGSEFLVNNPEFVNRVWLPCSELLDRRYEIAFLSHSFGALRFPFNAERVTSADEWQIFRPGRMHETLFDLEAAKALLGIDYDEKDASAAFAGDLQYRRPANPLVGMHAGSKQGRWLSKRWPYFRELASDLVSHGVPVASFGNPDEYIEGTEDRTGGSLEQMSRSMLDCTFFVSNDSGPSHIASALGIPSLVLFAPTDPFTHAPLQASTVVLALQKQCSPCEVKNRNHFASGQCRCIADITVQEVEKRVKELMKPAPISEAWLTHEKKWGTRETER